MTRCFPGICKRKKIIVRNLDLQVGLPRVIQPAPSFNESTRREKGRMGSHRLSDKHACPVVMVVHRSDLPTITLMREHVMPSRIVSPLVFISAVLAALSVAGAQEKPNLRVIWGDDIGVTNISHNSRGMLGYKTPNIDRIAAEGVSFTDYYGQQSCTAGRAAFVGGMVPV